MKRLTLVFNTMVDAVSINGVCDEINYVLLRLHPRITYKLGQVRIDPVGRINVHIAIEGERELLENSLHERAWKLPIRYEGIKWGWITDLQDGQIPIEGNSSLDTDPLAGIEPTAGMVEFQLNRTHLWLRYYFTAGVTLVWISVLIAFILNNSSSGLEYAYLIMSVVWMIALSETPLDLRLYAKKLLCGNENLEVVFWLKRKTITLDWDQITGLVCKEHICEILYDKRSMRFLLSRRYGCKEKDLILKTLVNNAQLYFVQGSIKKLEYRR